MKRVTLFSLLTLSLFLAVPLHANEPFALNEYALALLEKGEHDKALEQLQKAYGLNPYDQTLKKNLAEAYTYAGQQRMSENNCEAAAESFDRARELFPEIPRYYVMRGIALYYCKYPDAAQNELERARGIGGDSPEILFYLAKIQYDSSNLADAVELLEKALALKADFKAAAEMIAKLKRELAVEGSMDRDYSSKFVISYDAGTKSHLAGEILDTLEEAYNSAGRDLATFPAGRITVIIYTKKDYKSVTAGPDWSGGLYDGKIRIPVGGAQELNKQLKAVLFHEYSHVVVQDITGGNCPAWLNEGLAELAGRKIFDHPLSELARAARSGNFVSFATLEEGFSGLGAREAALAYQQSYSLVNFMVDRYGWPKIKEILLNLRSGMKPAAAIKQALADFGLDFSGVIEEWRREMKNSFDGRGAE